VKKPARIAAFEAFRQILPDMPERQRKWRSATPTNWPRRSKFSYVPTFPRKGSVYTVRAIAPRVVHGHDEDGLHLVEIANPTRTRKDGSLLELAFRMSRFRPLRTTNIDVFLEMLEPVPSGHLLAEPVLRAHRNVSLTEERRLRERRVAGEGVRFNMCVPSGTLGERLAEAATAGLPRDENGVPLGVAFIGWCTLPAENAPPVSPERRQRAGWLRTLRGLGKRPRPS
jgi:hypothetical protein